MFAKAIFHVSKPKHITILYQISPLWTIRNDLENIFIFALCGFVAMINNKIIFRVPDGGCRPIIIMRSSNKDNLLFYLGAFSWLTVSGAMIYQIYRLNWLGVMAVILIAGLGIWLWGKFFFSPTPIKMFFYSLGGSWLWRGLFLLTYTGLLLLIWKNRSDQPLISPWQVVPQAKFFILYGLTAIATIFMATKKDRLFLPAVMMLYGLTFSLTALLYKIGYGFDSFIHQAALRVINEQGWIDPKTPYYVGQYAIEIVLHRLTFLPLELIDKFLVMVVGAAALPAVFWRFLRDKFSDNAATRLSVPLALIFSFTPFIMTTPQSLAYILMIATVLMGQSAREQKNFLALYLMSAATLSLQPIAGIPAILLTMSAHLHVSQIKPKKILYALILIINTLLLPAIFLFLHGAAELSAINWTWLGWPNWPPVWLRLDSSFLGFAYFYGNNLGWLFGGFLIGGAFIAWRIKQHFSLSVLYLTHSATLLAAYFLTKLLPFDFLIDYEKNNYADRLLYLSLIIALPFALTALRALAAKILTTRIWWKTISLTVALSCLCAAVYISYPRYDRYYNSHGYATSTADLAAVRWINDNNADFNYVVLANQQVGAASLRLNSFAHYFQQNIFYYSIPTGGPLYERYLKLTKKPSREPIIEVMDLVGVNKVYVVINSYWWEAPKIIAGLQSLADNFTAINNGEIYIFQFNRNDSGR